MQRERIKMDIEISEFQEAGYMPIVDYMDWRVAVLKYCEELEIDNITSMQKHMETDEVFVLLQGECTLFSAGDKEEIGEIRAWRMEPLRIYNVKKGVWHTHTLAKNTSVLIVENRTTGDDNSPTRNLSENGKKSLRNSTIIV
jgi:ureidoglycolate hydrolase